MLNDADYVIIDTLLILTRDVHFGRGPSNFHGSADSGHSRNVAPVTSADGDSISTRMASIQRRQSPCSDIYIDRGNLQRGIRGRVCNLRQVDEIDRIPDIVYR